MNYKSIACLVIIAILQSCTIVGLKNGYNQLSKANRKRVIRYSDFCVDSTGVVALVSHEDLIKIMQADTTEYQIIYKLIPHCTGEGCISIATFSEICKSYGIKPIVVSNYLANSLFDIKNSAISLYAIDSEYYKSPYVFKYAVRFKENLTNGIDKDIYGTNMYLFRKGEFLRCIDIRNYKSELAPENINTKRTTPYTKEDNPFGY